MEAVAARVGHIALHDPGFLLGGPAEQVAGGEPGPTPPRDRHREAAVGGVEQGAQGVGPHRIGDLAVSGLVLPGEQLPGPNQRLVTVHVAHGGLPDVIPYCLASGAAARRRPAPAAYISVAAAVGRTPDGDRAALEVYHWAGEGPGDAVDRLDARHYQLAELVDVVGLGPDDHVVGAGDRLGLLDAGDVEGVLGDLGRLADLGLDQDVRRHHRYRPPCLMPPAAPCGD